jgi:hypothetical protein
MKALRLCVTVALPACIVGCASAPSPDPSTAVTSPLTKPLTVERVNAVSTGKSTKADVLAALGEALVISFESGYEVWVYRLAGDPPGQETRGRRVERASTGNARSATNPEFVILFAPSGVVAKTRLRLAREGV